MSETIKLREVSPLVQSVIALDKHVSELERLGQKIEEQPLKSEFDFQQVRKLMASFAEHGQGVADEVTRLSLHLNEARERAGAVGERVALRAQEINGRDTEQQTKLEQFRLLAEKVRGFNASLATVRPPEGQAVTDEDRRRIHATLREFDAQLEPLIGEAQTLRREAHAAKMKGLEQNADALAQTLLSVRQKVRGLDPAQLS